MNESFLLYSGASTASATHLDLIIAVYDGLARDLNRIADAVSASDIECRCKWTHHALNLLGYLEVGVEELKEPELERSLIRFYAFLRSEIMRLQVSKDGSPFRDLAMRVCETRAAWQQKAKQMPATPTVSVEKAAAQTTMEPDDRPRLAWTA